VAETGDTQKEPRLEVLLLMLMGIVILLMVAIVGLFLRMNQLQREVVAALAPLRIEATGQETAQETTLKIGTPAPAFTLPDVMNQTVRLSDFAGQRVLLVFFSTRCPACAELSPNLKLFSESREDVRVVMISLGSSEEKRQLIEEQGFGFPVLTWDDAVARDYKVPGTPFFYVIDGEGVIVNKGFANSLKQLEELVEASGG
jgi:methylamine dehydrogenase accessory protein MauD